jgi:hypothetical protein
MQGWRCFAHAWRSVDARLAQGYACNYGNGRCVIGARFQVGHRGRLVTQSFDMGIMIVTHAGSS